MRACSKALVVSRNADGQQSKPSDMSPKLKPFRLIIRSVELIPIFLFFFPSLESPAGEFFIHKSHKYKLDSNTNSIPLDRPQECTALSSRNNLDAHKRVPKADTSLG